MMEQWHPLGVVGIISAFNFPVAVWAWNSALAAVCGDAAVWKPSEQTPLTALAVQHDRRRGCVSRQRRRPGIFSLVHRRRRDGRRGADRTTRACRWSPPPAPPPWAGRVAEALPARFGRAILELGGNNAIIVHRRPTWTWRCARILFGAMGTAGQRCTNPAASSSTRRIDATAAAPDATPTGRCPSAIRCEPGTLMGPLVNAGAVRRHVNARWTRRGSRAAQVLTAAAARRRVPGGCLRRAGARRDAGTDRRSCSRDLRAHPLRDRSIERFERGHRLHNDVPAGPVRRHLHQRPARGRAFLSARGSDCGIANVNIGTCGAEIGGAFGGEKETGGGRETGSDAWKAYMRRQPTPSIGRRMPMARGQSSALIPDSGFRKLGLFNRWVFSGICGHKPLRHFILLRFAFYSDSRHRITASTPYHYTMWARASARANRENLAWPHCPG